MRKEIIDNVDVVAQGLDALAEEVVFTGSSIIPFLVIHDRRGEIRPTKDIDCVIDIASYVKYAKLEERLRQLGFRHAPEKDGGVICRWEYRGLLVDVMPTENVLGPTNSWFRDGMKHAIRQVLPSGREISIFSAPYFIAAKLDAFHGRGKGDIRFSQDMEDIVLVLAEGEDVEELLLNAAPKVRRYLAQQFHALLASGDMASALPGMFSGNHEIKKLLADKILNVMSRLS